MSICFAAANLKEFVGKVGVYGDMNDILTHSMRLFAGFVESNDLEEIRHVRAEGRALAEKNLGELWEGYEVSSMLGHSDTVRRNRCRAAAPASYENHTDLSCASRTTETVEKS